MVSKLSIRREDKNVWERRTPLTPDHVRRLVQDGVPVVVQPSEIRAFPDKAYREAGAEVSEDLSGCPVMLAVKEIPSSFFLPDHVYMYFAHVIKGQPYNMPMLRDLLDSGSTLIDYEKVTDDQGRRLIFFGRHAGLAGMMDSLWALGQRLEAEGFDTPFVTLRQTHAYKNLEEIKHAVGEVGKKIAEEGLPPALTPMVFGFAGYGNVSQGAQEIFDLLPHQQVAPEQLHKLPKTGNRQKLVKAVFKEEHLVRRKDPKQAFNLQEYYDHPDLYDPAFDPYVPLLTVMVNCIYWAPQYPRLITKARLRGLHDQKTPSRLRVIGDISCDVAGAVECTLKCTQPGDPVFVYRVSADDLVMGVEGPGPVVLAVDNLPCELPVESSQDFGDALMPFIPALVEADYTRTFEKLDLPAPIMRAMIAHRGVLTHDYGYLSNHIDKAQGG
jgi:saccharopine dehydrogenase (NAD+, L-lysine-forming)